MTRPRKQTVDWFPHSCTHGRTMFTLERKYGIQGYGFWFKLLEVLGNTEGHFIDAEDLATMKYLQAQTYTDEGICLEILNLLAALEAIDPNLWERKLIWSDNFVSGLAPCYRNRNITIPVRPDNYRKKPGQPGKKSQITVEEGEEGEEGKEGRGKDLSAGEAPPTALVVKFTVNDLAVLWNEKKPPELSAVNLPLKRPEKDMTKIKDALKRNPEREWWERVILRLHQSPHCRGNNDRGWKASFDFMVGRAEVILDGKYDGGTGPGGKTPQPGLSSLYQRKMEEFDGREG